MFNGSSLLSRRAKPVVPLAPPELDSVPAPMTYFQPADHHERMRNMRNAAQFLLGDPTWADELYTYYADITISPEDDPLDEGENT